MTIARPTMKQQMVTAGKRNQQAPTKKQSLLKRMKGGGKVPSGKRKKAKC